MIEKLIRCARCNQVVPHYDSFGDFGNPSFLPGVEWSTEDLEKQEQFFSDHQGHLLEELHVVPETLYPSEPTLEPMKVGYFETSNGRERFLIRRSKKALDHPASYEIVPEWIFSNWMQFFDKKVGHQR